MSAPRYSILNVEPKGYSAKARAVLAAHAQVVEQPLSRPELLREVGRHDALIVRLNHRIDREVIDAGTRLRAIVSATTGLDHIDLERAAARGIAVLSLRGETEFLRTITATAEHTWALLLALIRLIPASSLSVQQGQWDRDRFRGRQLSGKRLGLVGLGRVGRQVARFGQAFGMTVAAYDPQAAEWLDGVERVPALEALLPRSDVLSLHVHLTPETRGMIGTAQLSALPDGAVLVNTSRGALVDEAALLQALECGRLAGAALDVLTGERTDDAGSKRLVGFAASHNQLLITPHLGGATHESMEAAELFMAQKLAAFLNTLTVQEAQTR